MPALRPEFSVDLGGLIETLDTTGFACLENAVDPAWLERARGEVDRRLEDYGHRFFTIIRPANESHSAAQDLVHELREKGLMRDLTQAVCPQAMSAGAGDSPGARAEEGGPDDIYNVLRIIAGPKGSSGSLEFHYDASVVTMLVPLFMPSDRIEGSGALVTIPNRRGYRRTVAGNVIEKIVTQNRFYRAMVARTILKQKDSFAKVLMPGNIYLFWGYRTYHGNLACAPNSKRATLLLHYGNPHGDSATLKGIRRLRKLFETAKLKLG